MVQIQVASPEDARDFLDIYSPFVEGSEVSFEYTPPTVAEYTEYIRDTLKRYPYLKLLVDGAVAGFAYANPLRERRAYDWSAETTIYLKKGFQGRGFGARIYGALFDILRAQGIVNAVALIVHPYQMSEGFHERLGFDRCALIKDCAFKNGKWLSLAMYQKRLVDVLEERPAFPVTFPEVPKPVIEKILIRYSGD